DLCEALKLAPMALLLPRAGGRRRARHLRIDLLAGDGAQDARNDDAVVAREPLVDHAQVALLGAERDLALLHDIVLVDDEHVASALVAAERRFRNEQGLALLFRNAHAHEIAR